MTEPHLSPIAIPARTAPARPVHRSARTPVTFGFNAGDDPELPAGGWFLATGIGNNPAGIFASVVRGETGMTTASAPSGYTYGCWALAGSSVVLFPLAPFIQRLMHDVK